MNRILVAAVVALGTGGLESTGLEAKAATWKSPRGYSLQAPAGWTIGSGASMGADVIISARPRNGFTPNFNVVAQTLPRGATLAQVKQGSAALMKRSLTNYKLLSQGYGTLAGTRALSMVSSFNIGSPPRAVRITQMIAVRNGRAFVFTGTAPSAAFASYNSAFARMFKSVRWTK